MMSVFKLEEKKQLWNLLVRLRKQALSLIGVDDEENLYHTCQATRFSEG
jgi:hypothetical protein